MKRYFWGAAAFLILAGTAVRLSNRWREEASDHRVTLMSDWSEVRDEAARLGLTDDDLLSRLRNAGANALLISPSTVQEYLGSNLTFSSRVLAEAVQKQLADRQVAGVTLKAEGKKYRLIIPSNNWLPLKDLELGFNPELLGKARQAGFNIVLRVNQDPWMTKEKLFSDLQEIGAVNEQLGVMLNTDDIPGGNDALGDWVSFLESQHYAQLLFEFHPTKAAMKVAYKTPLSTFRAHTIPSNELRDLTPDQEQSRWRRAVQERSCRFLLLHIAPADSLSGYLASIDILHQDLIRQDWIIAWPKPRTTWSSPSLFARRIAPLLALLLAIIVPIISLKEGTESMPMASYLKILFFTLIGASIMAAVAHNPLTRLEIVPFKGIKLAFALSWLGCLLWLYSWNEIKDQLYQSVRRFDVLIGLIVAMVVGYLLVRTGNAGAGWKIGWEQGLRDHLEDLLIARPRFKEFAVGYPLLFLGLHLRRGGKMNAVWQDGRLWILLGMIGPISMVNTFCHLHSPLYLAFLRSLNGMILGTALGTLLLAVVRRGVKYIDL